MILPVTIPDATDADARSIAAGFAALGHPARLTILRHLAGRDACCCGDLVSRIDLAQSTVSQHLKVLVAAGLVRYEPESRRSRYSLDREALARLSVAVGDLTTHCCDRR
jgi:DNA-binding transcriptional ArsR family regulator